VTQPVRTEKRALMQKSSAEIPPAFPYVRVCVRARVRARVCVRARVRDAEEKTTIPRHTSINRLTD